MKRPMTDPQLAAPTSQRHAPGSPPLTPLLGGPAEAVDVGAEAAGPRRRWWMLAGGVVLVLAIIGALSARRPNRVQYLSAAVLHGEIRDAVEATGTVNAVVTVLVGSQVSGTIAKLNADFNSRVHKGDVIAI